ncbi:zinc finger, CCHC-type containing protein, partial [Tanacetum coccineum]
MFRLNIINDNIGSAFMSTSKLNDSILWHARLGHIYFKRMQDMSKDGLIPAFDMDTKNDLCDLHATPSLGNKKYFVTFIDDASRFCYVYLLHSKDEALDKFKHSKAFRFYIIKPNESVEFNSIIESMDAIFDENRFSSVPRPSLKIPIGTEDIGSLVVPKEVTEEVDLTKEFLSSKFSMKDMGEADVILVSTSMDTSEKLMPNNGKLSRYTSNPGTQHWQAIQWVLKYLKKTMDYKLIYTGYPSVLEGYTDAIWINNTEDNSSTSGWVFMLSAAGKEAKWLKNLLLEILLWSKPIAPIYVRYDNVATLAKAYSQIYNGKSRHL